MNEFSNKKYFLKITNPTPGTYYFLREVSEEFNTTWDEYWRKIGDPDTMLVCKPLYDRNFNHVIILRLNDLTKIEFIGYLLKQYKKNYQNFEELLKKTNK